jgi:hypothetical protein
VLLAGALSVGVFFSRFTAVTSITIRRDPRVQKLLDEHRQLFF